MPQQGTPELRGQDRGADRSMHAEFTCRGPSAMFRLLAAAWVGPAGDCLSPEEAAMPLAVYLRLGLRERRPLGSLFVFSLYEIRVCFLLLCIYFLR